MNITSIPTSIFLIFPFIFLDFFAANGQDQVNTSNAANPAVSLVYKDTLALPSFTAFDLPVRIKSSYSISAISLGFYFPVDYLSIDTVEFFKGKPGAYYNITDSLFRMSWSDINPIIVQVDDSIILLKMNSLDLSTLSNTLRIRLDDLSEFADQDANVIEGVVLEIPEIAYLKPDPGDSIGGNTVNVYPNPFRDFTTVYFSLKTESRVKISLTNTAGIAIKILEESSYPEGNYQFKIDGLEFSKGIYLLKFEIQNSEISGEKMFKLLNVK